MLGPMKPTITAFKQSPDRGRGLARDMRVRWALEEVEQPSDVRLVTFAEMKEPAYRALQPFGQIPAYQEGDLALFESGSIVLRLAETHAGRLLPADANGRARAITWMFAALNTLEPPLVAYTTHLVFERDKPWFEQRLPLVTAGARKVLGDLDKRLDGAEWLDGAFSAGDLMLAAVLWRAKPSGILNDFGNVAAYMARAEARPAFQRAFAAQHEVFVENQPAS
jgi:glutathione S-transferase